jgi:hypothetical protein
MSREVTITKLDHSGEPVLSYPGVLVYRDDEEIVARCVWGEQAPLDLGPFCLEPGDVFVETYYPNRWFNVFEIYEPSGILKGWYCNVTRPVEILASEIRWWDLALDLLITPDGSQTLLDEDEFESLHLSDQLKAQAARALRTLLCWLAEAHPPFNKL